MTNDPCNTCQSPLEAALIAQDLALLDSEQIRIEALVSAQDCKIEELEKKNSCLAHSLDCCEKDKAIIVSRLRASVGKFQSIRVRCRT